MKIAELSKDLGVTNKELIEFLKKHGYKVSSHMHNATDEMIECAEELRKPAVPEEPFMNEPVEEIEAEPIQKKVPEIVEKVFKNEDMIPCRSVTPWKLNAVGVDKNTVYHWEYFGDVDYVSYRDLQALRRTDYITQPKIIIEDPDLCYKWRRELGDTYKHFLGIDYPEDFFEYSDEKFSKFLTSAPVVLRDVIKVTALNMIKNENYPSLQKITIIDELLGTCLKEFL